MIAAKFICPRCGKTIPYDKAKMDGYLRNVWVCPACYDRPHPADIPVPIKPDLKPLPHPGYRRIEDFTPVTGDPVTHDDDPS